MPLTPSFVADAIAPVANNRYSVPYESSYPSHGYHILYKVKQIGYNIWFLFYMACFPLPQIGERNGAKTLTVKTVDTYCFSRVFMSERISARER